MMRLQNIFLIGPMGAGKSTVGRQLAESLGYEFRDSDQRPVKTWQFGSLAAAGDDEAGPFEQQVVPDGFTSCTTALPP